tara:strand:+ start:829 stop:1065 length:237 start_codon:yes stop_codon:yes gene_type:complete
MNLIENKIDFEKMFKKLNVTRQSTPEIHLKHLMIWAEYQYGKSIKELANDYDLSTVHTKIIIDHIAPYKIKQMKKLVA